MPVPGSEDEWLDDIARAYVDALGAVPFGIFTMGAPLKRKDLFHLAPDVCMKFRSLPAVRRQEIVEGALASYVVTTDEGEGGEALRKSPVLAFVFCYLAAHFVADLVDEETLGRVMDRCCDRREALMERIERVKCLGTRRSGEAWKRRP